MGFKNYELTNHLGNVMAVVNDRRLLVSPLGPLALGSSLQPEVLSYTDYYPFGSPMPGREYSATEYRYGFQNQEKDNEIYGEGNGISFKYRLEDSRLGRFFSIDPLTKDYPHNSSYAFAENRVIDGIDLEGSEFLDYRDARIMVIEGELHLRLSNFSETYQDAFQTASDRAGNLVPGGNGKIYPLSNAPNSLGWTTKIADFISFSPESLNSLADDGLLNNGTKIEGDLTMQKNGVKVDGRAKENKINASGGLGRSKMGGYLGAALVVADIYQSINMARSGMNFEADGKEFNRQVGLLKDFQTTMNIALSTDGLIPESYRNKEGLTDISNFVLTGEFSGDQNVRKIGTNILTTISKNYKGNDYINSANRSFTPEIIFSGNAYNSTTPADNTLQIIKR